MTLREEIKRALDPVAPVHPTLLAQSMAMIRQRRRGPSPLVLVAGLATALLAAALGALLLSSRPHEGLTPAEPRSAPTVTQPSLPIGASVIHVPVVAIAGPVPPDMRVGVLVSQASASERFTLDSAGPHYFSLSWGGEGTVELAVFDPAGKEVSSAVSSDQGIDLQVTTGPAGTWTLQVRKVEARGPISWAMVARDQPVSLRYGLPPPSASPVQSRSR